MWLVFDYFTGITKTHPSKYTLPIVCFNYLLVIVRQGGLFWMKRQLNDLQESVWIFFHTIHVLKFWKHLQIIVPRKTSAKTFQSCIWWILNVMCDFVKAKISIIRQRDRFSTRIMSFAAICFLVRISCIV